MRLGLLGGGAALVALAVCVGHVGGTVLRPYDFSPQADESHADRGWAFSRPSGLRWEQFMVALRCDTPGVTTEAVFDWPQAVPVTVWVAFPHEAVGMAHPSLQQGNEDFVLTPEPARSVRDLSVTWLPYTYEAPLAAGGYVVSMTTDEAVSGATPAWFGEVIIRPAAASGPQPRGVRLLTRMLRTVGLVLLVLAVLPAAVLGRRRLLRVVVAVGVASFIDRYLPTVTWSWSDDDWHMLPDQSALLDGDLRGLLESHNGHILPVYRILWQLCYLVDGTSGFPMRFISALWTVGTALLLLQLLRRWTRSELAAAFATAFFLANYTLHDQSLTIIAATNFSWAAGTIVVAMFCFDRYLRRHTVRWLLATAGAAATATLLCGAGIVAFPAVLMQYLCLAPRARWRWSRRALVGGTLLAALIGAGVLYHLGKPPPPGQAAHWPANGAACAQIGQRCWEAFVVGLQTHWPAYSFSPRAAGVLLLAMLGALCLPWARRRQRLTWLAGAAIALAGYLVVFGIRTREWVALSHYHVVAYIGLAMMGAAMIAAYARLRHLRRPLGAALLVLLVAQVWHGIHVTERTYPIWEHAYRRQDRLVNAVTDALHRAPAAPETVFLSDDRVRYLLPTTRISISGLAAIIQQRSFCDSVRRQPHPPLSLDLPLLRDIYRSLAREYVDGLWPPRRDGTLLVADADVRLPTAEFLGVRRAPDAVGEVFVRLALPYELERTNGVWGAWLTRSTRVDLFSAAGGMLRIRCRLSPGPSNSKPQRTITVTCGEQKCVWKLKSKEPAICTAEFTIPPGTTAVDFRVTEKRVRKSVHGDTRERMLRCERIELELGPPAPTTAPASVP